MIYLQTVCLPFWDAASCIPPVAAGEVATLPCMAMFGDNLYNTAGSL